jgi:hypothetical protein
MVVATLNPYPSGMACAGQRGVDGPFSDFDRPRVRFHGDLIPPLLHLMNNKCAFQCAKLADKDYMDCK